MEARIRDGAQEVWVLSERRRRLFVAAVHTSEHTLQWKT